ncbi:MAG: hypothetical protein V2A56_13770, partial [bacterium]
LSPFLRQVHMVRDLAIRKSSAMMQGTIHFMHVSLVVVVALIVLQVEEGAQVQDLLDVLGSRSIPVMPSLVQ